MNIRVETNQYEFARTYKCSVCGTDVIDPDNQLRCSDCRKIAREYITGKFGYFKGNASKLKSFEIKIG